MQKQLTDYFDASSSTLNEIQCSNKLSLLNISQTTLSPNNRKRKSGIKNNINFHQTIIDAGQKKIGLQHCQKCGMVYNIDDKNDLNQHKAFHNRFEEKKYYRVTISQIESWKSKLYYETVEVPIPGILFKVNGLSSATLRKKFEDIIKNAVNDEIGYSRDLPIWDIEFNRQGYAFIASPTNEKEYFFVAGIILIDLAKYATLMPQKKHFFGDFLSVNRIWTHIQLRRKKIATFLLDTACRSTFKNYKLPRTRIAFNDPTDAGVHLAKSYIGSKNKDCFILHLSYPSLNKRFPLNNFNNVKGPEVKRKKQIDFDNREKENNVNYKKINCFGFEEEEDSN